MKSGFITLVGRSNVGKSTLLNTLIGTKIAAVTHKPQTTRNIIHGVLNAPQGQAVFVDTPGVFKEHGGPIAGKLEQRVKEAMQDIDLIIYVVDPTKIPGEEEKYIQSTLRKMETPKILVINKSDLPQKEKQYLDDYLNTDIDFIAKMELSALLNRHIQPLRDKVFEYLPEGVQLYPDGELTNISREFWMAEVIREKIFLALRQEVPYSVHVEVESVEMDEKKQLLTIKATVFTDDSKYKKMIIGARGRAIKEIGIAARKELETAMNVKIYLELEVEKDAHWEERI